MSESKLHNREQTLDVALSIRMAIKVIEWEQFDWLNNISWHSFLDINPTIWAAQVKTSEDLVQKSISEKFELIKKRVISETLKRIAINVGLEKCPSLISTHPDVDLEVFRNGIWFLINFVDTNRNFPNQNIALHHAVNARKSLNFHQRVEPVLGYLHRKAKTFLNSEAVWEVSGQNLWYLLTEDEKFYGAILQELQSHQTLNSQLFDDEKKERIEDLICDVERHFCNGDGVIDWREFIALVPCRDFPPMHSSTTDPPSLQSLI